MANKKINIQIGFNADTSQAERNLAELSQHLQKLSQYTPNIGSKMSDDMRIATNSAKELEVHFRNAFNTKTGNLDLSKLNMSLKNANTDLATLTNGLLKAGIQGEQAFMKVQNSLMTANVQLKQTETMMSRFFTTLKNTARWQISASILQGFTGAIQSAYRYSQDLNKSLNDIRIVTGYSVEEMSEFAIEANKAAKALSTTTTEYAKASLIFYQQGLTGKQVQERTDVVIKMANVTGQAAQEVSDYMTAIWNNFNDGSKSLEYYADVITALGAATASSTEEISTGLEKFAAIAETVGLSYEYATSALATVTAETRQSAEVVGTAFKTLFARIQDLELGKTLDDGTTMGQYSEALAKVGISIKDNNGNLKEMDIILNEMAGKWETLNSAQQTALAQKVAGVRQYTQLIALMENWDKMQQNLNTVEMSTGELDNQANIYAESWEAANKRVKASAESIYQEILDDEFFIKLTNGFADLLDGIKEVISGIGGIGPILLLISSIVLTKMAPAIGQSIQNGINRIQSLQINTKGLGQIFQSSSQQVAQLNQQINKISDGSMAGAKKQVELFNSELKNGTSIATQLSQRNLEQSLSQSNLTKEFKLYLDDMTKVNNIQALIEKSSKFLTQEQKEQLSILQQQTIAIAEKHTEAVANVETIKAELAAMYEVSDFSMFDNSKVKQSKNTAEYTSDVTGGDQQAKNLEKTLNKWKALNDTLKDADIKVKSINGQIVISAKNSQGLKTINQNSLENYGNILGINKQISNVLKAENVEINEKKQKIAEIIRISKEQGLITESIAQDYTNMNKNLNSGGNSVQAAKVAMNGLANDAKEFAIATGNGEERIVGVEKGVYRVAAGEQDVKNKSDEINASLSKTQQLLSNSINSTFSLGQTLSKVASGASTVAMGISSVVNGVKTLSDDSATGIEKLTSATMMFTMGMSALMVVVKGAKTLMDAYKVTQLVNQGLTLEQIAANYGLAASELAALWPIGLVIAALVALTAIVVGVIKVVDGMSVSLEESAEQSKKAAEDLKESFEEAKQEFEDLKASFDAYDKAVEALEACKKGTDEWKKALEEVNNQALEIINKTPDLLKIEGLFTRNSETGMLEIDESKKEEVLKIAENKVDITQAASLFGTAKASQDQAKLNRQQMSKDIGTIGVGTLHSTNNSYYYDGYLNLGELLESNIEDLSKLDKEEYATKVREILEKSYKDIGLSSESYSSQIDGLVNKSLEYQNQIDNLAIQTKEAAIQMSQAAQIIADNALGDKYDGAEKTIAGAEYKRRVNELADAYEALFTDGKSGDKKAAAKLLGKDSSYANEGISNTSESGNKIYKLALQGLRDAGYNWTAATDDAVQGWDDDRRFTFVDEKGERTAEKGAKWVAETIAAAQALKELEESGGEKAEDVLKKMDSKIFKNSKNKDEESLNVQETTLRSFISSHDIGENTASDFNTLYREIAQGNPEGISTGKASKTDVAYYLDQRFGDGKDGRLSKETAEKYGFETAEEMIDAFYQQVTEEYETLESIDLPEDLINTDGLTTKAIKKINDIYNKIELGPLGKEKAEEFLTGLNSMTEGLSEEDRVKALEQLGNIDWSSWDAVEQAKAIMQSFGKDIDLNSEQWQRLTNIMRISTQSVPDFSSLKKDLSEVSKILDSLDFGSVIGEYEYNEAWKEFFILQADGSRKFIGDAKDMKKATQDNIVEQMQYTNKLAEDVKSMIDAGWGYEDKETGERVAIDWFKESERTSTQKQSKTIENLINSEASDALLKTLGYEDDRLKDIAQRLTDTNEEVVKQAQLEAKELFDALGKATTENYEFAIQELEEMMASTATTFGELDEMMATGQIKSIEAYTKAWESLQHTLTLDGLDETEVDKYAEYLQELYPALKDNEEIAFQMAAETMRVNRGIEKAADSFETWEKVLNEANKTSQEYFETLNEVKETLSDLTGVSTDYISGDFIKENFDKIKEAANGSVTAIDDLKSSLSQEIVAKIILDNGLEEDQIMEMFNGLEIPDIEAGVVLSGDEAFINSLNEMVKAAGMTSGQVEALMSSMGFQTTFAKEPQEVKRFSTLSRIERTKVETDDPNKEIWEETVTTKQVPIAPELVETFAIATGAEGETVVPKIETIGKSATGGGVNTVTSPGGSASSSKPKKAKNTKKSDVVERYKEIDDTLSDLEDTISDTEKAADRLWGPNKISAMEKVNKLTLQNIEALKKKRQEAEGFLKTDKEELENAVKKAGINFEFDENGNITNYTSQMEKLWAEQNNAINAANADGNVTEEEQENLDSIQEKIDAVNDAYSQYEDTREVIKELDNTIQDEYNAWQDRNYEIFNAKLELEIELDERELKILEYKLAQLGDNDFFQSAEKLAIQKDMNKKALNGEALQDLQAQNAELERMFKNGEISEADYIKGLYEIQDKSLEVGKDLMEFNELMKTYYSDTVNAGLEEIHKFDANFEHLSATLDHYENSLSLLGREQDYDTKNAILDGRMQVATDRKAVSEKNLEGLNIEKLRWENALALEGLSEDQKKFYQQQLDAVNEQIRTEQEAIYGYIEEIGKVALEKLQNNLEKAKKAMEKELTGGSSFDYILDNMSRLDKLQDLYLTDTNKIYETTTLVNKATQDMNKTSNIQAKQRYAEYQKYIQQLQESENLSQYDLDIAKAKYEVLQAQIALEEAKDAKDQVRLTRDAEGNFGYVYTANENKIADAEQALLDAQNNEYNISLEAAKEYSRLSVEALQEGTEAMAELWNQYYVEHSITEEEFNQRSLELQEYYQTLSQDAAKIARTADVNLAITSYGELTEQDNLYFDGLSGKASLTTTSVSTSLNGIKTALTGMNEDMVKQIATEGQGSFLTLTNFDSKIAEIFKSSGTSSGNGTATQKFFDFATAADNALNGENGAAKAFATWQSEVTPVIESVGGNFETTGGKIDEVKTKSSELNTELTKDGGLIDTVFDEIEAVGNSTEAWGLEYDQVDKMIEQYGTLAESIQGVIDAKNEMDGNNNNNNNENENAENNESETGNNTTSGNNGNTITDETKLIDDIHFNRLQVKSGDSWIPYAKNAGYSDATIDRVRKALNASIEGDGFNYDYAKTLASASSFDTGGYTGSWGSEGKMAVLHEKEIVLNKQDTSNLLQAITMLREISNMIDRQAMYQSLSLLDSRMFDVFTERDNKLQQEVTIHAEFPNVNDHNEIEIAIENLVNRASQYANRNN